jgi:general secretion pathway protein D
MTSAAKITLRLVFFLAIATQAQQAVTPDPVQIAEEEAVRRQEATIRLHIKLDEAVAAQRRNQLVEAAKLYQEAVVLSPMAQVGNATVDLEKKQALAGLDGVREKLARQDMARGEMAEALAQVQAALKVDPNNETLRNLKAEIDKRTVEMQGMTPSPDLVKTIPDIQKQKVEVSTMVQNAKLLYEMGKYKEAEDILLQVLKIDPSNKTAPYYLDLVKEARFAANARAREAVAKSAIETVERAWIPPSKQDSLPVPNPLAHTNLVYTTPGRQAILSKLEHLHLDEVKYDALSLKLVLDQVRQQCLERDPDRVGVNFMWNPHAETGTGGAALPDASAAAAAGAVASATPAPPVDINSIIITIDPQLTHLRLSDALDAITKAADQPIKFTVEDYAVVFSPKSQESAQLYTKVFKVDPNTFVQGLQNVSAIELNTGTQSSGTGGGGGGGGGGSSGGGGSTGGSSTTGVTIPSVLISQVRQGGQGGGGITGGQTGGNQVGLAYVTKTNSTVEADEMVRAYFIAAGVDLSPTLGKMVFFNDRLGELMVRATLQDLEIIEQAVELLNQAPPQLTIEAKFVELSQEDSRALGFNWYLGNTLLNQGAIGVQGGTAPSYQGNSTAANPSGIFPGPGTANGNGTYTAGAAAVAPSASDNLLTSGLRNVYGPAQTQGQIPTVATISGIMTDPQFRVAIEAIQQRTGSDLLSAPKVTTLSGRQTHIAAQDLVTIVTSVSITENSSTATGLVGGSGVTAPALNYNTTPFGIGPKLDVMPTVSADGFSIQMVLIPTILEFIGYDSPGGFVPQAEAAAGSTIGVPVQATLPLPRFRVREVVTSCNVWDGQTVVLGGMIAETITKIKDQVPVLGDLPLVGRLFQSESTDTQKQNLLIFVTPTIIDPAGNRVHNDDDMPFARTSIPPQPPVTAP